MPIHKILFTIPNFLTAGSGRAMLNVAERLDPSRFAPSICVAKPGGALCEEVERLGIPLIVAPFVVAPRPLATLPFRAWRCAQKFRRYGFDLWHSFHYLDDYTEPVIARLAGAKAWVYTKKNMNWRRRSWLLRTWLASGIAAQNTTMMNGFFDGHLVRRKARLLPPGVDHESFHPQTESRLGMREVCAVPEGATVVAIIAHIVPVKGHATLIRAVASVPDLVLWIIGRPDDQACMASLVSLVDRLGVSGRIKFLGPVADVPAVLSEVDIFVLSSESRGEGCPVALLEAMSAGRACVATDVPGSKDLIRSGENGILVPPGDHAALSVAIRTLSVQLVMRAALGKAARETVESSYTLEREATLYETMYQEILT